VLPGGANSRHEQRFGGSEKGKMKTIVILLKGLGYILAFLAFGFVSMGLYGIWIEEGFSGIQETLSPFNIINWLVTLITFLPSIGAFALAFYLENKLLKNT